MKNVHTARRISLVFCFSILFAVVFFSCGKNADREIIIGTHLTLSGGGAMEGQDQKWSYEQAIKDINAEGGIYVKEYDKKLPVRLVMVDDESDSGKAATAVERLIKQDKVDMILSGQVGAIVVLPGMLTAEKYKKYYHGTVIWKHIFLEHKFKWASMYFIEIPDIAVMPFELFNSLPPDQRPKKIGLFMEDTFDGKAMGDGATQVAKKYNYDVVFRTSMAIGAKDYSSEILKAKAAGVDAIICFNNTIDTVAFVKQMKQNKFSVKAFQGIKGTWSPEFWTMLGNDAEGIMLDGFWSEDYPYKGAKELGERYTKQFGKYSVSVGMYYAVCQSLFQAIEKAGTLDGAKIREAVLSNTFETVNGQVKYDENGVCIFPVACFAWKDGKQVILYPFNLTKNKMEVIKPWNKR
jgi:branched-chain amino acid transport system substrate-binding protein